MVAPWWRHGGAMVVPWWRHGGAMVVPWWRHGGVMVASWWRHGGVMVGCSNVCPLFLYYGNTVKLTVLLIGNVK